MLVHLKRSKNLKYLGWSQKWGYIKNKRQAYKEIFQSRVFISSSRYLNLFLILLYSISTFFRTRRRPFLNTIGMRADLQRPFGSGGFVVSTICKNSRNLCLCGTRISNVFGNQIQKVKKCCAVTLFP